MQPASEVMRYGDAGDEYEPTDEDWFGGPGNEQETVADWHKRMNLPNIFKEGHRAGRMHAWMEEIALKPGCLSFRPFPENVSQSFYSVFFYATTIDQITPLARYILVKVSAGYGWETAETAIPTLFQLRRMWQLNMDRHAADSQPTTEG